MNYISKIQIYCKIWVDGESAPVLSNVTGEVNT